MKSMIAPASPLLCAVTLAVAVSHGLFAEAVRSADVELRGAGAGAGAAKAKPWEPPAPSTTFQCPGSPPCSGHGSCDSRLAMCWCDTGYGGSDCNSEVPDAIEVMQMGNPALADMIGKYKADGMYLEEDSDAAKAKFLNYDVLSGGWAATSMNSPCTNDVCFFGYANGSRVPPPKGYVFGQPNLQVYYKQLIFDDADIDVGIKRGYHMQLAYTPDPQVIGMSYLASMNGRYIFQPRYTQIGNGGKYSIFPVDFKTHRTWVVTGLLGEPKKQRIIMSARDPSTNRYTPPAGPWEPPEYGFRIQASCTNQITGAVCAQLEHSCTNHNPETPWVQKCCRSTCSTCGLPRQGCPLPQTNTVFTQMYLMKSLMAGKANHANSTDVDQTRIASLLQEAEHHERQQGPTFSEASQQTQMQVAASLVEVKAQGGVGLRR